MTELDLNKVVNYLASYIDHQKDKTLNAKVAVGEVQLPGAGDYQIQLHIVPKTGKEYVPESTEILGYKTLNIMNMN